MNEAETRAELIDPKLKECGWGDIEGTKILREHFITNGRILVGGLRGKKEKADYVLTYKGKKLAVVEAKAENEKVTEGVTQAKEYAELLHLKYTYSTNGKGIYEICMETGEEKDIDRFPTPDELWNRLNPDQNDWKNKFDLIPFQDGKTPYYFQEIAINKTLDAIAQGKTRLLLTLATGTGKTFVAFQIAWKLFQSRWNLQKDGSRLPRILFLADRNVLANQAFNSFSAFPEDALIRIDPADIRKRGSVPTNGSIFFTIFQTFMSGSGNSSEADQKGTPYFGDYPKDFFDFIIIDECHRGGANDESNWRGILEYFSSAVQLGLTATPKRLDNINTYRYFGEPIYTYSLKQGIEDGFLTPFKVKRIQTTLDEYVYTSDDEIIEGEIEEGKVYEEPDFNKIIEIKAREAKRVQIMMDEINQTEKTIVFCATQDHALAVRDLINQYKKNSNPFYCARVTANEGARGDQFLADFQDNEKTIPTILTTSQKLSTGVDARNIRNIVLMRPVNSMIEFKQIIGRGTRLYDGKEYFTIYDFVGAYKLFSDPEWDGEPIDEPYTITDESPGHIKDPVPKGYDTINEGNQNPEPRPITKIKLRDGKEREIQHMMSISYWSADGKPLSLEEFLNKLVDDLPQLIQSENEFKNIWSNPTTRKDFLDKLKDKGYGLDLLNNIKEVLNAKESDLYDALLNVMYAKTPMSRKDRVEHVKNSLFERIDQNQKEFIEFVLEKYIENGVEELSEEKLPVLLNLKYQSISDAEAKLGDIGRIRELFFEVQDRLYG